MHIFVLLDKAIEDSVHSFRVGALGIQDEVQSADHRGLEVAICVAQRLPAFFGHAFSERLPHPEILDGRFEARFAGALIPVGPEAPEEVGSMKADSDEQNLCDEKETVDGDVRVNLVEGCVWLHREMWWEIFHELQQVIVELQDLLISALLLDLLEMMDDTANEDSKLMAKNDEGHGRWMRKWLRF